MKRINKKTTVYLVRSLYGNLKGAFLNKDAAKLKILYHICEYGENYNEWHISEIDLPFVGKYIYNIYLYKGFDYGYSINSEGSIYDVSNIKCQNFFASRELAKKNNIWITFEKKAKEDPENHHIYDDKICSDDYGLDWCYGDVMENKFTMEIQKTRIKRQQPSSEDIEWLRMVENKKQIS